MKSEKNLKLQEEKENKSKVDINEALIPALCKLTPSESVSVDISKKYSFSCFLSSRDASKFALTVSLFFESATDFKGLSK